MLGSALPRHSCLVSKDRFSAAERQSVTLQYLWTIFRGVVLSALLCTRQSTYPDLHNLCVTTSIVCWVLSPRECLVFFKHWQHPVPGVMCQTIDSLEYRCAAEAAIHVSSPGITNKRISPPFLQVVSSHADSFGWIWQGFEISASGIYAAIPVQCRRMECGCAHIMEDSHFKN